MTLAEHAESLARAFHVSIVYRNMDPAKAGAGHRIVGCGACGAKNRIVRSGYARCGQCKHDFGWQSFGAINIAPITNEATYAIALHELGHVCSPLGMVNQAHGSQTMRTTNQVSTLRDVRLQLEEEEAAWSWAQHYATTWTPTMQRVKEIALASYYKRASQLGVKR
jgi:hypothetical protein